MVSHRQTVVYRTESEHTKVAAQAARAVSNIMMLTR